MSLILEALRRSEAERQLGRAPDVLTPMPVLRASRRVQYWPWWVALAVALTVLALGGMWRFAQQRSPATPAVTTLTPPALVSSQIAAHHEADALSEARPAITASNVAAIPLRQSQPAIPRAPAINAVPANTANASSDPAVTAAAARIATPPPAIQAPVPVATETPPASADALLSIADLSPSERAALPALKVSMHVYAEQPGDRFMIVDGARVGEGARIGDHIVLVQIRRDGGVLDISGRRLLLPKP